MKHTTLKFTKTLGSRSSDVHGQASANPGRESNLVSLVFGSHGPLAVQEEIVYLHSVSAICFSIRVALFGLQVSRFHRDTALDEAHSQRSSPGFLSSNAVARSLNRSVIAPLLECLLLWNIGCDAADG